MYSSLISFLQDDKIYYVENHSLKNENSLKIDTKVDISVYPDTTAQLVDIVGFSKRLGLKFITVGNISNVIFRDAIYHGVVIHTTRINSISIEGDVCSLACGCNISSAIRKMAERGYGGLEALAGIPGTVGGMICSNAGAFGKEISDFLLDATVLDTDQERIITLSKEDIGFSYRNSMFYDNDRYLILSSRLLFEPTPQNDIRERLLYFREKRNSTQPHNPSLGSVFKRNRDIGAGYYIDRAGLKGMRVGGAMVSPKHAGFIVNVGDATSRDFLLLVGIVKAKVYMEFGIELDTEIKIID